MNLVAPRAPAPSLTGPVHPLFARNRWEVSDEDYQLLMPSMRLATRLLEVGMPYLAIFCHQALSLARRRKYRTLNIAILFVHE